MSDPVNQIVSGLATLAQNSARYWLETSVRFRAAVSIFGQSKKVNTLFNCKKMWAPPAQEGGTRSAGKSSWETSHYRCSSFFPMGSPGACEGWLVVKYRLVGFYGLLLEPV